MPILFSVLFLVMLGFGLIIPIMPFWGQHFGASAFDMGLLMASFSLMQFLFAPIWGAWSDRVGRRPVLLIGLAGFIVTSVLTAVAGSFWQLFLSRLLQGVLSAATLPTAMAMIGDTTTAEKRAQGMGLLGAAMGLGMVFGPGVGGWLSSEYGLSAPFWGSAALATVTLIVAFLILKESLPVGERQVQQKQGARLEVLLGALRGEMGVMYTNAFFVSFAMATLQGTFGYYISEQLGLDTTEVGNLFMAMGLVSGLTQGVLVGPLVNRFGEVALVVSGLLLQGIGFFAVAVAHSMPALIAMMAIFGLGSSLLRPAITALISKNAQMGQGTAIGVMDAFDSLGRVLGPLAGGYLYLWLPEMPFYLGGVVSLVLFVLFAFITGPRLRAQKATAHL